MSDSVFVIAEVGVNHNGSLDMARELIEVAHRSGADAVKFQTFQASEVVTIEAPKVEYQIQSTGSGSQLDMVKKLELSHGAHFELKELCDDLGIEFMSTAFDFDSLRFLVEEIGVKRVKVPSGELTNLPLLLAFGAVALPLIVSTGMASLEEVEVALTALALGRQSIDEWVNQGGTPYDIYRSEEVKRAWLEGKRDYGAIIEDTVILHCTSQYPAPLDSVNLRAMDTLGDAFGTPVGYSDHTLGAAVSIGAVARGAVVIEKHITLDCNLEGPDHQASMEPEDLSRLVRSIREVSECLGSGEKVVASAELQTRDLARRSLVAKAPISTGDPYSLENLSAKRPGTGLSPMEVYRVIGEMAEEDLIEDQLLPPID